MMLKSQERSQRKPYVIALRSTPSRLASLHSAKLLYTSMVCFYRHRHLGQLYSLKLRHFHFVGRPVFNVAVSGNELEYLNEAIPLEMNRAARLCNLNITDGSVASSVWINLAVSFQLSQPEPPQIANSLEIIQAPVPAIKQHALWLKASLTSCQQHLPEMIVLRRAIRRLVIETIVTRYVTVAIGPHQSDEVDAAYYLAMFARPVTANEFNLASVLFIKGRIIQNQYASFEFNLMTRFLPEVIATGFNTQKQAVDGIVSRRVLLVWLHPGCFCAAVNSRGSNQKVNVIVFIAFWGVHSDYLHYHASTA
jgi:hypothetical protein